MRTAWKRMASSARVGAGLVFIEEGIVSIEDVTAWGQGLPEHR